MFKRILIIDILIFKNFQIIITNEHAFLKKYQPKYYKDFIIDNDYINILKTMHKIDSINVLLVGDSGCGKTSLLYATMREYYNKEKIPPENVLLINNLKEQGIQYYRNELKTFCKTPSVIKRKKIYSY